MLQCEQTPGQSVYQHGLSVEKHINDLISHLKFDTPLEGWKIPDWLIKYRQEILSNYYKDKISLYARFHDCGKPYCRIVDEDGKVHFPNHAEVSKQVWLETGGDQIVGNLIGWDMCLHTANAQEIERLCSEEWTVQDAATLLLAALAEIHSNAKMFGGIESQSFKIKFKQLDRRGKQICKHYFEKKEN